MTSQIIIDFDQMDDEQAHAIASAIEGFVNRQFPTAGMHGSIFVEDESALPDEVGSPVINGWSNKPIVCRNCGHDKFVDAGRSLDTYNHRCTKCGHMNHTMTETGMSA